MPMRCPLVFNRERSALLSTVVEKALEEGLERGLFLGVHIQKARMILVGRVIGAIEKGECDPETLTAHALERYRRDHEPKSEQGGLNRSSLARVVESESVF
jgi:hypothetical protein